METACETKSSVYSSPQLEPSVDCCFLGLHPLYFASLLGLRRILMIIYEFLCLAARFFRLHQGLFLYLI